jgi:hypothetical protein
MHPGTELIVSCPEAETGPIHLRIKASSPSRSFCGLALGEAGRILSEEATGDSLCPDCVSAWEQSLA